MKVYEACCYAVLTITITASCAQAEAQLYKHELHLGDKKPKKGQLSKRDAFLLLEHFPVHWVKQYPKFINSGVAKQRNMSPKPRYGVTRTRYTIKPSRKMIRWHRNSVNPKYGEPSRYKRPPKLRYAHQKASHRPRFQPLKRRPQYFNTPEPGGFGEPPIDMLDYSYPKPSYGEPPIRVGVQRPQELSDPIDLDSLDYGEHVQKELQARPSSSNIDSQPAASYKQSVFENHLPSDGNSRPFFDFFNYERPIKIKSSPKKKKPNRANTVVATWAPDSEAESQIVVGGRYAEPPARYFSHFDHDAPLRHDDGDYAPPEEAVDPDVVSSATVSPYVNYKSSNVAFSAQNLNDVFGIVE